MIIVENIRTKNIENAKKHWSYRKNKSSEIHQGAASETFDSIHTTRAQLFFIAHTTDRRCGGEGERESPQDQKGKGKAPETKREKGKSRPANI